MIVHRDIFFITRLCWWTLSSVGLLAVVNSDALSTGGKGPAHADLEPRGYTPRSDSEIAGPYAPVVSGF